MAEKTKPKAQPKAKPAPKKKGLISAGSVKPVGDVPGRVTAEEAIASPEYATLRMMQSQRDAHARNLAQFRERLDSMLHEWRPKGTVADELKDIHEVQLPGMLSCMTTLGDLVTRNEDTVKRVRDMVDGNLGRIRYSIPDSFKENWEAFENTSGTFAKHLSNAREHFQNLLTAWNAEKPEFQNRKMF